MADPTDPFDTTDPFDPTDPFDTTDRGDERIRAYAALVLTLAVLGIVLATWNYLQP